MIFHKKITRNNIDNKRRLGIIEYVSTQNKRVLKTKSKKWKQGFQ